MYPVNILGGLAVMPSYPEVEEVERQLTFRKFQYHQKTYAPFRCVSVRDGDVFVPRKFPDLAKKLGPFKVTNTSTLGLPFPSVKMKRNLKLFNGIDQEAFVRKVVKETQDNDSGGYALADCGTGKTFMGLDIARRLGTSTLVLVSREYQIRQWQDEAAESYEGLNVGVYRGKKKDWPTEDMPVIVGTVPTLTKVHNIDFFKRFGLVIFDECHHAPAETWAALFSWIQSRYILGLTAGLTRGDGLDRVFRYFMGDVIAEAVAGDIEGGDVWQVLIPLRLNTNCMWSGAYDRRTIVAKMLANSQLRTAALAEIVSGMYRKGRNFFVFSDLKKHLADIRDATIKIGVPAEDLGCFYGQQSKKAAEVARSCRGTFTTYQMASEGLNIPIKDSLLCATPPKTDLRQLKGRVTRYVEGKPTPFIVDPVDKVSQLETKADVRYRRWLKEGMNVKRMVWTN